MVDDNVIKTIAYISSTVFFLLASALIYLIFIYAKRQRLYHQQVQQMRKKNEAELLKATLTTQENERERIGANLHDDIGPLLSSFKMYFKNELKYKEGDEKDEVEAMLGALDDNIEQVRDFSRDLVPNVLHQFGLKSALDELKRRFEKNDDISISISIPESIQLEIEETLSIYRIIQESINNAIRHGNASIIEIKMYTIQSEYEITITDNGAGFDISDQSKGLGLRNIEARCKSMEAELSIKSSKGKGTKLIINELKPSNHD
jgi:signal transduction histidine kinase